MHRDATYIELRRTIEYIIVRMVSLPCSNGLIIMVGVGGACIASVSFAYDL